MDLICFFQTMKYWLVFSTLYCRTVLIILIVFNPNPSLLRFSQALTTYHKIDIKERVLNLLQIKYLDHLKKFYHPKKLSVLTINIAVFGLIFLALLRKGKWSMSNCKKSHNFIIIIVPSITLLDWSVVKGLKRVNSALKKILV